jgi:microcystin-dependent protein
VFVALENGTYVTDLVPANPADTDGLNQAGAHMRLIKSLLKNTFPNFSGAVNSTPANIDAAVTAVTSGSGTPEFASVTLGDDDSVISGSSDGSKTTTISPGGTLALTLSATAVTAALPLSAPNCGVAGAAGLVSLPVGAIILWYGTNPPPGWAWCNGQALSRTLPLYNLWGTSFGAGDGSTTFNVLNLCEWTLVGAAQMGGAASRGMWGTVLTPTLGTGGGTETTTLTLAQTPAHRHPVALYDPGHAHTVGNQLYIVGPGTNAGYGGYTVNGVSPGYTTNGTSNNTTGCYVTSGDGVNNSTQSQGGGGAHSNVQPSIGIGIIVKVQ